jgi:hypothetical protein
MVFVYLFILRFCQYLGLYNFKWYDNWQIIILKDFEISGHGVIKVRSRHLLGGKRDHYEKSQLGHRVSLPILEPGTFRIQV